MQRFKDTEIWSEDWFCDLGGEYMLFWNFITDKCDNAGIWKPNKIDFEVKAKYRINLDSFFKKVNGDKKRLVLLENGRWFIPGFINYQWFNKHDSYDLVLSNKLHLSIFELLEKNKIPLKIVRGLKEVLKTSKDKDMEKEIVFKEEEKGVGKGEGFWLNEKVMQDLSRVEINAVKSFIHAACQKKIIDVDVIRYWDAFRINNQNTHEWYGSHEKLMIHFRHSLKNELNKSKNELKPQSNASNSKQATQSRAIANYFEIGEQEYRDLRKEDS